MTHRRWVLCAVMLAGAVAHADVPGTGEGMLVLKDGTILHGTIVELVDGDHVVIRLDGEAKTFPWAAVATVVAGSTSQPALPVPFAQVRSSLLDLHGAGQDGPLVDWPEPDRSPPNIMTSRFSLGIETGVGGLPVGSYALAAELYPWTWGFFQLGLHGAYGPNGLVGPTVSEMLTFDWSYGSVVQQGLGFGFAHSFRSTMSSVAGAPDRVDVIDADVGHVNVFLSRQVMLRGMVGLEFPISAGCNDTNNACGNASAVYGLLSLLWNFDLARGDE